MAIFNSYVKLPEGTAFGSMPNGYHYRILHQHLTNSTPPLGVVQGVQGHEVTQRSFNVEHPIPPKKTRFHKG